MSQIDQKNVDEIAYVLAQKVIDNIMVETAKPRWMTIKEAADYAKASKHKIRTWVEEGYIYGFKRTGKLIVDRESIDAWYSSEKLGA